jgi:hypothetical protein
MAVAIRIALFLLNGRSRIQIELLKQQIGDSHYYSAARTIRLSLNQDCTTKRLILNLRIACLLP